MALMPEGQKPREDILVTRFKITGDNPLAPEQLQLHDAFRIDICEIADEINHKLADSREKSLAIAHLEEALMWAGKANFNATHG